MQFSLSLSSSIVLIVGLIFVSNFSLSSSSLSYSLSEEIENEIDDYNHNKYEIDEESLIGYDSLSNLNLVEVSMMMIIK